MQEMNSGKAPKGKIHPASVSVYTEWLRGYLKNGGKPTHSYNYPLSNQTEKWFVADSDFEIQPLYGTQSINIIIPKGVKFLGGDLGHNKLYFMDDFKTDGGFVPIFNDIKF